MHPTAQPVPYHRSKTWTLCLTRSGLAFHRPLRSDIVEAVAKLSAAGEDAPLLISLLGLDDRNWVLERYPETKLINGMISLIAYWAP